MPAAATDNLAATAERGAWAGIDGEWSRLFGDFPGRGVSVEWHDFQTPRALDWARSFHEESMEICYNLSGSASVRQHRKSIALDERTVGFYAPAAPATKAERGAGGRHCFITVELSRPWLRQRLGNDMPHLLPAVRDFLDGSRAGMSAMPMGAAQQALFTVLRKPPVPPAAQAVWFEGKVCEIIAHHFYKPVAEAELFCARQKRIARERVERVRELVNARLAEPPTLDELARAVGCSAFYLSRIFSQEAGMTIPQYLRQIRMERAAELLLTGKFNVTEAALEVGYSSMSHFSRAFCETTGYCPALYTTMMAARQR
jgi:AraC family transcriptional regulator